MIKEGKRASRKLTKRERDGIWWESLWKEDPHFPKRNCCSKSCG